MAKAKAKVTTITVSVELLTDINTLLDEISEAKARGRTPPFGTMAASNALHRHDEIKEHLGLIAVDPEEPEPEPEPEPEAA